MRRFGLNYQERKALREANAEANAEARAARAQAAMTCQVCGRGILANKGVIAHHGYQRPGSGWQTASCGGAKELPFQVSRDALAKEIANAEVYVEQRIAFLAALKAEEVKVVWTYTDYSKPHPKYGKSSAGQTTVHISREEFPAAFEVYKAVRRYRDAVDPNFDSLKASEMKRVVATIEGTKGYIAQQQERFNGWKQTHERRDGQWVALEVAQ
jgi:hypothetical protein